MSIKNQVVLITGASGGLGQYVVKAFIGEGARVIGVSRSGSKFEHPRFTSLAADIGTADKAKELAAKVGAIDVLVHTVGGFTGGKRVDQTDAGAFAKMFAINFDSALNIVSAVVSGMRERGKGCILAIGSRAALEPVASLGAYSASKAALVSLIKTVALENKDRGITANVILPGTMDTPANRASMPAADFSKWVPVESVAALLVHLSGNRALTGAVVPVYGGEL